MTNPPVSHGSSSIADGGLHATEGHFSGHDFANGGGPGITFLADDASQDIALGEHAEDVMIIIDDDQRADLLLVHEVNGIQDIVLRSDRRDDGAFLVENFTDVCHDMPRK